MKKLLLLSFLIPFSFFAQITQIWQKTSKSSYAKNEIKFRSNFPQKYTIYNFDLNQLKSLLSDAPLRQLDNQNSNKIVSFPNPFGSITNFKIFENPIMEDGLANRYQNIKTYIGIGIDNPNETLYFSITDSGLHVMSFTNGADTYYIDSFSKNNNSVIIYNKKDIVSNQVFECGVNEDFEKRATKAIAENISRASDGTFRIYRLAMACTIEYAAFHINAAGLNAGTLAQKKSAVLSAMVVTMNRVNGVFEKDMSLRMNLVANNDSIIFIDLDTLDNSNVNNALLNQIQAVIDRAIGFTNYDIGHVFSTGGGGVAQLQSPCGTGKARGVTGRGAPVGDPFDIDYVAHEMGHQYGANHTQNNGCNRSSASVEPGSASTIMGYAGICAPNVQGISDDHFNAISIAEMSNFLAGSGGSCPVTVANGNFAPVVNAGIDYTIPKGTAFVLKGAATDANNDSLTYCWEQQNSETSTQPPTNTALFGPNFRSLSPSLSPERYMPNLVSIVAGNLNPTWEVIPNVARTLNFSLTVRDNRIVNGGQTGRDDTSIIVANVGPFLISAPNTNVSWQPNSNQVITWEVAGTNANGINCLFVDILLSSDGGITFPTLLASKVPNDGLENISIPTTLGTTNRIMVRGNNHIFLDVTNTNFTIANPLATFGLSFSGIAGGQNKTVCQSANASFDVNYYTLLGFSTSTTLSVTGNPAGSSATLSQNPISAAGIVTLNITDTALCLPGFYTMTITGTSGAITKSINLYLEVLNSTFDSMQLTSPSNNTFGISTSTELTWVADPAATNYDVQVATDDTFTSIVRNVNVTTNSCAISGLVDITNYFWRVISKNIACSGAYSNINRFTTEKTFCVSPIASGTPITINTTEPSTINSTITIPIASSVSIFDINVSAEVAHTYTSDLALLLISPTGTQVQLVVGQCGSSQNINATFDDAGSTLVCGSSPAIVGTIKPAQLLSAFNGQNSAGIWILRVIDNANGDGGFLNTWSMKICAAPDQTSSCGQIATTWNGSSWTNGKPVSNVQATIAGNYIAITDLNACSLEVTGNSQVTVNSGVNLTIKGAVSIATTANVTFENNANLIQLDDVSNTGKIKVKRNTIALKRLDYVNWSSPVSGIQTLKQFSPLTLDNRFYIFKTQTNVYEALPTPETTTFITGKANLIRMPDSHPTTPTIFNGQFMGTPNNGQVAVNLLNAGNNSSYNLVGNPYPSPINATDLLTANAANINGALYFWRKTNAASGTAYATYSLGGATTASPTSAVPNGIIQVGQGFLVEALNVATPKITFTNALRIKNNTDQFFRFDNTIPYDRVWLNLSNTSEAFSQMLVSYMPNATNTFDLGMDTKGIDDSPLRLSSSIGNDHFTIQARAPFQVGDVVPLQFKTDLAGTYTIAIDHLEGLFQGNQDVFLKDNVALTVTNLKINPYTFVTTDGIFNTRFELIFQNTSLTATSFETSNNLMVSAANSQIKINSSPDAIEHVLVYDLLGRQLYNSKKITTNQLVVANLNTTNQALLVKITLADGKVETRKIMF